MSPTQPHRDMPYRILGRTGERVSAIGLGGWHIGFKDLRERDSIRIIREAIDRGINFLDNSRGKSLAREGTANRKRCRTRGPSGLLQDPDRSGTSKRH